MQVGIITSMLSTYLLLMALLLTAATVGFLFILASSIGFDFTRTGTFLPAVSRFTVSSKVAAPVLVFALVLWKGEHCFLCMLWHAAAYEPRC